MSRVKKKNTADLKALQEEIKRELKIRASKKKAMAPSQIKGARTVINDIKKLMKGKTLKLVVTPKIPVKVTVCLTDGGDISFCIHESIDLIRQDILDEVNKSCLHNDKIDSVLSQMEKQLS